MDPKTISHLILTYRYWLLVPLAVIEGPIVAFVAGTLASLQYFNIYALLLFFLLRDLIMDGAYYALGYYGSKISFTKNILKKVGVQDGHLEGIKEMWEKHPVRTMFIGKLSYGISQAFVILAGMIKMSLKKFFQYGIIVALVQYGTLLVLGYFFGNAFSGITQIIENVEYALAGITLFITCYYLFTWYMRRKFLKKNLIK